MPSLQGKILRQMIKLVVRPKFDRCGEDVQAWRNLDAWGISQQRPLKGTRIEPWDVAGTPADRVIAPGVRDDRIILYLHGGGFLSGSPATHHEIASRISAAVDAPALVLDYRLAPEHPFPAAVADTLVAYRWLQDRGFTPDRIALGGDSAGGGLTLQTLLTLRDEGDAMPAAAFLMSPPTDWVRFEGESYETRASTDPLIALAMCRWSASLYVGEHDPGDPRLCIPDADLSGLPPLCIHVGDGEVLLSDSVRVAERALQAGVEVQWKVWPGMWHVFPTAARFIPEGRRAIEEIGAFVGARLKT